MKRREERQIPKENRRLSWENTSDFLSPARITKEEETSKIHGTLNIAVRMSKREIERHGERPGFPAEVRRFGQQNSAFMVFSQ